MMPFLERMEWLRQLVTAQSSGWTLAYWPDKGCESLLVARNA